MPVALRCCVGRGVVPGPKSGRELGDCGVLEGCTWYLSSPDDLPRWTWWEEMERRKGGNYKVDQFLASLQLRIRMKRNT